MAKGFTILPNGMKLLFGLEAEDIPDLSADQITSDQLDGDRLPDQGIEYSKLAPVAAEKLVEKAERELALARELIGQEPTAEIRAGEHYGLTNIEVR